MLVEGEDEVECVRLPTGLLLDPLGDCWCKERLDFFCSSEGGVGRIGLAVEAAVACPSIEAGGTVLVGAGLVVSGPWASEGRSVLELGVLSLVAGMPLHSKDEEVKEGRRCWVVRIVTGPWGWHQTARAMRAFMTEWRKGVRGEGGGEELAMERHRASAYYGSCVVCRVEEGGVSDRKCVMGGVGREAKKELKVT